MSAQVGGADRQTRIKSPSDLDSKMIDFGHLISAGQHEDRLAIALLSAELISSTLSDVQTARSIRPVDRVAEHLRVRAGTLVRPIVAQQEDRPDLAGAVAKSDVEFRVAALAAEHGLGSENAAIQIRPLLARVANNCLVVPVLVVAMPDFDSARGTTPRFWTRAIGEFHAIFAVLTGVE
jgi:hypothetical protein